MCPMSKPHARKEHRSPQEYTHLENSRAEEGRRVQRWHRPTVKKLAVRQTATGFLHSGFDGSTAYS